MTNEKIMEKLDDFILGDMKKAMDEITRLRAENETLRRDVKTAVMGDSAELADVKRENEKLRDVLKNCIAALRHAYFHGFTELYKTTADEAAAAIWESGE